MRRPRTRRRSLASSRALVNGTLFESRDEANVQDIESPAIGKHITRALPGEGRMPVIRRRQRDVLLEQSQRKHVQVHFVIAVRGDDRVGLSCWDMVPGLF